MKAMLEGILGEGLQGQGFQGSLHTIKDTQALPAPPSVGKATQFLVIQDDRAGTQPGISGNGVVTADHFKNYFVFGLVRRPCDYVLSKWYQSGGNSNEKAFAEFVEWSLAHEKALTASPTMQELYDTSNEHLLVGKRYDGHVHCFSTTHNLQSDLTACLHKFKECGGEVDLTHLDERLGKLQAIADENAAKAGRSTPSSATTSSQTCKKMFTPDLQDRILQSWGHEFIQEYNLGSCCS
jgi:hypothetical protein